MEEIIIPKEFIDNEKDIKLFKFESKQSNNYLVYLFKQNKYYYYYGRFDNIRDPNIVIKYIKEMSKENDQNILNCLRIVYY